MGRSAGHREGPGTGTLLRLTGTFQSGLLVQQPLGSGQQLRRSRLHAVRQSPDEVERRRLHPALDLAEVRPVDVTGERRRFLAQIAFFSEFSERVAEGLGARMGHRGGQPSLLRLIAPRSKVPRLIGLRPYHRPQDRREIGTWSEELAFGRGFGVSRF